MITNKKDIQRLIPTAIKALETVGIVNAQGKISKVNEGYINAMGPSIVQSGLLPTLIFYNKSKREGNNAEGEPSLWLKALYYMYIPEEERGSTEWPTLPPTTLIKKIIGADGDFFGQISQRKNFKTSERQILQYVVALKLALRTFVIEDKEDREKGGNE